MKRIYLATISIMSIVVLSGGVTAAATPILQGNTENEVTSSLGMRRRSMLNYLKKSQR